jgi:hypothetical protein
MVQKDEHEHKNKYEREQEHLEHEHEQENMNMDINMNKNSMPKKKWRLSTNFIISSSSMPIVQIKYLPAVGMLLEN